MTRTRYRIVETDKPYFITATINGWLPIFTNPESAAIVFDAWSHLINKRQFQLYAYVILENHIHFVGKSPALSRDIGNFKSFTARSIIDLLKHRKVSTILRQLNSIKLKHKTESEYQIWQEGFKPKVIENESVMEQKIDYIHRNPVERGFVEKAEHWLWSSARSYAGFHGPVEVRTDW